MKKRHFCWLFFSLLTACGFHLRGMVDMPPWLNNVALVIQNGHLDLGPLLKERLQAYNIRVNPLPTQADYLLVIERDSKQQQITNVGASTAPRQYLLIYDLQFTLLGPKGKVIIPSSNISVTRQLTVNNDRILGSDAEEILLASEMRREAVMQTINRLSRK